MKLKVHATVTKVWFLSRYGLYLMTTHMQLLHMLIERIKVACIICS